MKVRRGGPPAVPAVGDRLPPGHLLAHLDQQYRVVTVHRLDLPVIQNDVQPVDRIAVGGRDRPSRGRQNRRVDRDRDVDSRVPLRAREARGLESLEGQGPARGDAVRRRTRGRRGSFAGIRTAQRAWRAAGADDALGRGQPGHLPDPRVGSLGSLEVLRDLVHLRVLRLEPLVLPLEERRLGRAGRDPAVGHQRERHRHGEGSGDRDPDLHQAVGDPHPPDVSLVVRDD